jgi:hypothetical protein
VLLRAASALAVLVCAGAVVGCSEPPSAPPTPTALSEAEAFAAAEATYRGYVDAGNAERAGRKPAGRPLSFLVGAAVSDELAGQRYLSEKHWTPTGDVVVAAFRGTRSDADTVWARTCLDVSGGDVLNPDGDIVTPTTRRDRQPIDLEFAYIGGRMLLASSHGVAGSC